MKKCLLLAALILVLCIPNLIAKITIESMTVCDVKNPVGVDANPYFGWKFSFNEDNLIQSGYTIYISTDSLMNKGSDFDYFLFNPSSSQNHNYIEQNSLKPATKYYWRVKVNLNNKKTVESPISTFSTGLFTNSDWAGAKWIKRECEKREDYTFFRKKFNTDEKQLKRATVYVTAVHDYELYLNGCLVGKGPGYHYPQYQYYNSFDITSLMQADENLFACHTHWYGGGQGRPKNARGFLLKAVLEYADGSSTVVGTDESWKQIENTYFITDQPKRNGEGIGFIDYIDSRNELKNWNQLSFDDSVWENASVIGEHPVAPWTGILQPNLNFIDEEEITPVSVTEIGQGKYLIDLGKVYAGMPKITFKGGNSGDVINIKGGFTLTGNTINPETNQRTKMDYSFVLSGDETVFQPFVYLGMRYLQVENSPCTLITENVKFITRHKALDFTASLFESSNEMLNQVWELMKHTIVEGSQESFVDTPTREKGGFLGDSWSTGTSAMVTMGERTMNRKALIEFITSQDQYWADGRMNAVYPNVDGGRDIPDYTQMFLFWLWDYYMQTGDKTFLKKYYPQILKVAEYVYKYEDSATGLIFNLDGGGGAYHYGIIDWPETMRYGYDVKTASRTVMDCYAYYDFEILSKIAGIIGQASDQKLYANRANKIKEEINKQLINKQGVYIDGLYADATPSKHASQHANMLPLALGIVPERNNTEVAEFVKSKKMSVGMVTLRWLLEAIGQANEGEHLIELFTNTEWDGWANCISQGATTTWESWDAITTGQSLSHPWGTVGVIGIQNYILGVKPLEPQFATFQIKPLWFGDKLKSAKGRVPTDRGAIDIEWQSNTQRYAMTINIPANTSAKVYLPAGTSKKKFVTVNGINEKYKINDGFIYLGEFGSGEYTIIREW